MPSDLSLCPGSISSIRRFLERKQLSLGATSTHRGLPKAWGRPYFWLRTCDSPNRLPPQDLGSSLQGMGRGE